MRRAHPHALSDRGAADRRFLLLRGLDAGDSRGGEVLRFAAIDITLMFSDLEERILPDEFTLGGAVAGVIFAGFVPFDWGIVRLLLMRTDNPRLASMGTSLVAALVLRWYVVVGRFLVREASPSRGAGVCA